VGSGGGGGGGGTGSGTLAAAFTYAPAAPKAGESIAFDSASSTGAPTDFTWDFGDGSASSVQAKPTHAYVAPGTYIASLTVSKLGSGAGCIAGVCSSSLQKAVVVVSSVPPLVASFTTAPACTNQFGIEQCAATQRQSVGFTATATGGATAYSWTFGDGGTASGGVTSHAFGTPGTFDVTLTVTRSADGATSTSTKSFVISPAPLGKSAVVPFVIQQGGTQSESSDLYLYNPGNKPTHLTITFRNNGDPVNDPPKLDSTLQPGATLQVRSLLGALHAGATSGFIFVEAAENDPQPIAVSFHSAVDEGKRYGQMVPGSIVDPLAPTGGDVSYYLSGLNDTADRSTEVGVSNPSFNQARYHLELRSHDGTLLGSQDVTLPGFGQQRLQTSDLRTLGVNGQQDYRLQLELLDGGPVFPFATQRWLATDDPSFVAARRSGRQRQYVLALSNGATIRKTLWSSDLVLFNPADQAMTATLSFNSIGASAKSGVKVTSKAVTVQPGATLRVENVLGLLGVKLGVGVLTVESPGAGGQFPLVLGESTNVTTPSKVYGQTVQALDDRDAATAGQSLLLLGLREDAAYKSSLWFQNPTAQPATVSLTYRSLDGAVINPKPVVLNVAAGKPLQVPARTGTALPRTFSATFSVEVKVTKGAILAGAQVINKGNNDPAFTAGVKQP
jgi:PKD repeat protein